MSLAEGLNATAHEVFQSMVDRAAELRISYRQAECGAHLLDCGIETPGGIAAGIEFAKICLAGRAEVAISGGDRAAWPGPSIGVTSDWPVEACMCGQYAGWPVKGEDFFAMGSGPMRVKRGKEAVLGDLKATDLSELAVGTLECTGFPPDEVLESMAAECGVAPSQLCIAVAPTSSLAGCVQVVARSVETSLHKLHELGFDLTQVCSAHGTAPLPVPTPNFAKGIGRTNDAILYGGSVTLWINGDDGALQDVGAKLPSSASKDYGRPFADTFKDCGYDFYKIDPGLFSPAEVTLVNLASGNSWRFGQRVPELIHQSFGTKN